MPFTVLGLYIYDLMEASQQSYEAGSFIIPVI